MPSIETNQIREEISQLEARIKNLRHVLSERLAQDSVNEVLEILRTRGELRDAIIDYQNSSVTLVYKIKGGFG